MISFFFWFEIWRISYKRQVVCTKYCWHTTPSFEKQLCSDGLLHCSKLSFTDAKDREQILGPLLLFIHI
jgi:hypothetical protein